MFYTTRSEDKHKTEKIDFKTAKTLTVREEDGEKRLQRNEADEQKK